MVEPPPPPPGVVDLPPPGVVDPPPPGVVDCPPPGVVEPPLPAVVDPPLPGVEDWDGREWGFPVSFGMATAPAAAATTKAAATAGTQAGNIAVRVRVPDRRVAASGLGASAMTEKGLASGRPNQRRVP